MPPPVVGETKSAVGPVRAKVSNLDFDLRKVREFQNTSCAVRAKALTPLSLLISFSYNLRLIKSKKFSHFLGFKIDRLFLNITDEFISINKSASRFYYSIKKHSEEPRKLNWQ